MNDQLNPQEFVNFCRAQLKNLRMFEAAEKIGNAVISMEQSKIGLAAEVKEWETKVDVVKARHVQAEAEERSFLEQFEILKANKHAKLEEELNKKTDFVCAELRTKEKAIEKAEVYLKALYADIDAGEEKRTQINKDLEGKQAEIERIKAKFA